MDDASISGPANSSDPSQQQPPLRRELRGWTRDLAVALGLAIVVMIFLYQPVKVEGTSMAPLLTIRSGSSSTNLCTALSPSSAATWWCSGIRWTAPNRSSSAWSRFPAKPSRFADGVFTSTAGNCRRAVRSSALCGCIHYGLGHRFPADSYFVMGDHRISSNDSRVFGPVASQYIYGRAVFAYWPVDHFGSLTRRLDGERRIK